MEILYNRKLYRIAEITQMYIKLLKEIFLT